MFDQAKEIILRYLVDNGEMARASIVEFGKTRGFSERTTGDALAALLHDEMITKRKVGKEMLYAPAAHEE